MWPRLWSIFIMWPRICSNFNNHDPIWFPILGDYRMRLSTRRMPHLEKDMFPHPKEINCILKKGSYCPIIRFLCNNCYWFFSPFTVLFMMLLADWWFSIAPLSGLCFISPSALFFLQYYCGIHKYNILLLWHVPLLYRILKNIYRK